MNEIEELRAQLALAIKYKFDKKEIAHLQNLISQLEEKKNNVKNYSMDTINYPYGKHLV